MSVPATHPLTAVLLDLDDALVPWQTVAHWQWAWRPRGPVLSERHVRASIRRQLHLWDRRRWRGLVGKEPSTDPTTYRSFLAELLAEIAGHALPPAETSAVVERFLKPAHEVESFPDAAALLKTLAERSVRVGVIAALPAESAKLALRRAGLAESLLVTTDDDPGDRPPSVAGFRAAVERLSAKPRETLYVGDLFWSDVRAAGRAGLTSILIDRHDMSPRVQGPRIHSLAEVPNLLDRPPVGPEATDPDGPISGED